MTYCVTHVVDRSDDFFLLSHTTAPRYMENLTMSIAAGRYQSQRFPAKLTTPSLIRGIPKSISKKVLLSTEPNPSIDSSFAAWHRHYCSAGLISCRFTGGFMQREVLSAWRLSMPRLQPTLKRSWESVRPLLFTPRHTQYGKRYWSVVSADDHGQKRGC